MSRMGNRGGRLWLAPAYGLAVGGSYAAAWLLLERAATGRFWTATAALAAAATLAGCAAQAGLRLLPRRAFWPRFAASLLLLLLVTASFAGLAIFVERLIDPDRPPLPAAHAVWWTITSGLASIYLFLVAPGRLLAPFGLPAILAFAALLASGPRRPPRRLR